MVSTSRRAAAGFLPGSSALTPTADGLARGIEPRIAPRHETEIGAKLCVVDHEYDCTIRNVSTFGMTVALEVVHLCVGIQVLVVCESVPTLCGTIRWARGGAFGIEFVKPLSLDQVFKMRQSAPAGMQPRPGRARLRMPAVARFADQSRKVDVLNLSVGGLMMASGLAPKPGQRLMVEFPDLRPIGGHVRWSSVGSCGVMFAELLPISAAEELAQRGGLPVGWLDEVRMVHQTVQAN